MFPIQYEFKLFSTNFSWWYIGNAEIKWRKKSVTMVPCLYIYDNTWSGWIQKEKLKNLFKTDEIIVIFGWSWDGSCKVDRGYVFYTEKERKKKKKRNPKRFLHFGVKWHVLAIGFYLNWKYRVNCLFLLVMMLLMYIIHAV